MKLGTPGTTSFSGAELWTGSTSLGRTVATIRAMSAGLECPEFVIVRSSRPKRSIHASSTGKEGSYDPIGAPPDWIQTEPVGGLRSINSGSDLKPSWRQ
jgi:hypothetical protein